MKQNSIALWIRRWVLSFFTFLCPIIGSAAVSADGMLHYSVVEDEVCISGNNFKQYDEEGNVIPPTEVDLVDLVIPAMIEGKPVTTIGDMAFYNCKHVKSITLPDTLEQIDRFAFFCCTNLTQINIPSNVAVINGITITGEGGVFDGCENLKIDVAPENTTFASDGNGALFDKSMTTLYRGPGGTATYAVPNGVTVIDHDAFSDCTKLQTVELPETLEVLGEYAFYDCESLMTIVLPEGLQSIGYNAFYNCQALNALHLPSSVMQIEAQTFSGCANLQLTVAANNSSFCSDSGALFDKEKKELLRAPGRVVTYIVPEGVERLAECAFDGLTSLTSVSLPEGLVSIGTSAFYDCTGLTSIVLPQSVTTIEMYAFYNCTALTSINVPRNIETLGALVFSQCVGLKNLCFDGEPPNVPENAGIALEGPTTAYYLSAYASQWEAVLDENGMWKGMRMEVIGEEEDDLPKTAGSYAGIDWATCESRAVRIDTRAEKVASGVECVYEREGMTCDGVALSAVWDTTQLEDGTHVVAAEEESVNVLTVNTTALVEGGRLTESVTWGNELPHVVRHWVVVPSGVTLTIAAGAEVRFVSHAGLWVEDGGAVVIANDGDTVLFTSLTEAATKSYQVVLAPEASFTDNGKLQVVNSTGMGRWGSVSVSNSVTSEMYTSVNVPITVSATRDVPITVTWATEDGTAIAGEDYTAVSGTVTFTKNGATTQYVAVPIVQDGVTEETETFKVRITAAWGANVSTAVATVTLNNFDDGADPFAGFECGVGESAAVRIDARATLGGQLAHGTIDLSTAGGEEIMVDGELLSSPTWDTTTVADGLHTLTQAETEKTVAVLNTAAVQIEYGRLTEDVTWDKSVTHLVRNWVVIPSGKTLTITEGTVVKFTPKSGIWIEDGGTLSVSGSESELVMFTHSADDTLGAITDVTETAPTMNAYSITKAPNGTFTDNGWLAAMWSDVGTFGRVTLHEAMASANATAVRIPVTVSGTRNQAFTLRWLAEDGTAKLGEDYTLASGAVAWTGTSQGTKYIVIPLIDNPENVDRRTFTVRVQVVCGMNASMTPVTVTLYRNGMDAVAGACHFGEGTSAVVRIDGRLNNYGRIAHATEAMTEALGTVTCDGVALGAAWDTTTLADGLHTLMASEGEREVLTLNAETLEVVEGRLEASATWRAEKLYVVRHWVVIPSGKTLTVTAGTIVKFAEGAGIWVEDGGTLTIVGEAGKDVVFTHLADDSVGGDTDARPQPETIAYNKWSITKAPSGTVTDNGYWQVRSHTVSSNFAALTLHDAMAEEKSGEIWVPITVSGTRTTAFSVDWEVEATEDLVAPLKGTVTWSKVADGTKYIKLPIVVDEATEGFETFKLRLTTVRGANISDREATLTIYDSDAVVDMESLAAGYQNEANQPTSPAATVAPITTDFQDALIVDGAAAFRYSPYWQADTTDWKQASVEIAATRVDDGTRMTLFQGQAGEEGEFTWQVRNQDDGDYLVTHSVLNAEGEVVSTLSRVMHYITSVALHSGWIRADETWSKDRVHLVYGDVTVAAGVTLTIEPGAVVKFCDGTGLYAEDYTATAIANGAIFTHFADDTVGGDSNLDGSASKPMYGEYTLGAHVVVDENTEMRCKTPLVLASLTGGQSLTLESGNVYLVKQNINFPSGTTLTIEPGVVVKFYSNTSMTIASGATLLAQGTRAAPIIFTSYRDDTYGGDTNEDGNTRPQPGDWQSIIFTGGTGIFDYTHIRYACKQQQGAIYMTSGNVDFRNGLIYESLYDAVGVESGEFTMFNSVVSGAATAFRHWAKGAIVNSVFHGCGKLTQGGGQQFHNCIFMDIDTRWEAFGWNSSTQFNHCVFWNHDGDPVRGESALDKTGKNGNIWGDPKFVDPDNGDFHIQEGSAAIDMADGSIAPEVDLYGQPRMDVEEVENTGVPSANGACPDAGVHELMPRTATADVDFAVTSIVVPEAAEVGKEATFTWTVQNLGVKAIDGTWRDTLFLVNDYGQEVELGTVSVKGYIAPNSIKRTERTLIVPPMADGNWSLKVVTNAYRDIFEGSLTANNVLTSETAITIETTSVSTDVPLTGVLRAGTMQLVKIEGETEAQLAQITIPAGAKVYWGYGYVPTEKKHTGMLTASGLMTLSSSALPTYLVIENGGTVGTYDVVFKKEALSFLALTPSQILPTGISTVLLTGAGFDETTLFTFEDASGNVVEPRNIYALSQEEMALELDGATFAEGATYTLNIVKGEAALVVEDALTLMRPTPVITKLETKLIVPETIRPGRKSPIIIEYENKGSQDLPAPILEVSSKGQTFEVDGQIYSDSIKVMGLSSTAPYGSLRPNEKHRLIIYTVVKTNETDVWWDLTVYHAGQESAKKTHFYPEHILAQDWVETYGSREDKTLYNGMVAALGQTYADFYVNLANYASTLTMYPEDGMTYSKLSSYFLNSIYDAVNTPVSEVDNVSVESQEVRASVKPLSVSYVFPLDAYLTGIMHDRDNSTDGDVWWRYGSLWVNVSHEEVSAVLKENLPSAQNVLFICHGNGNSIHENWIADMADKAYSRGYDFVMAVDWGEMSLAYSNEMNAFPEETARALPDIAIIAVEQLREIKVPSRNLDVVGHSHGGHLAGIIANQMNARRLIGLDTSPLWTHEETPVRDRYPNAWGAHTAQSREFYKTSWGFSMATGDSEIDNDVAWGAPSLFITERGSFYDSGYNRNGKDLIDNHHELALHSFAHEWFRTADVFRADINWNSEWEKLGKLSSTTVGTGFLGVVCRGHLELSKDAMESAGATENTWRYNQVIGRQQTLEALYRNVLSAVSMSAEGVRCLDVKDEIVAGNTIRIALTVRNKADNVSIDYNRANLLRWDSFMDNASTDGSLPWEQGCGVALYLCQVTNDSLYTEYESGKLFDINEVFPVLKNIRLLKTWDGRENFCHQESIKAFSEMITLPDNLIHGPYLLVMCAAANVDSINSGFPLNAINYTGDLYYGDNFYAKTINVLPRSIPIARVNIVEENSKPGAPKPGGAAGAYLSSTSRASVTVWNDLGSIESSANGAWSVRLTGRNSSSENGRIIKWNWVAIDEDNKTVYGFNPSSSNKSSETKLSGQLPLGNEEDEEGNMLPVPKRKYYIGLFVEDETGVECEPRYYELTVKRGTGDDDDGEGGGGGGSTVPQSCDPNEISGPMGEGAQRFVAPRDWLTYTVYFENKPDATGAAQEVKITHTLDEELDWSTFELIDVAYHNQIESGLAGKASGVAISDLSGTAYKVRTEATLDETTGQAYWYLRIVDESTVDKWPADAYAGILPPNNDAHDGEGHVTYRVKVREDARYGARIDSTATIIFDYNEPIETDPSWWNTVGHATSELPEVLLTPVYVDGAEGTLSGAKTYKVGQKASLKATPAKGSVFAGWYLDAACTLPYNEVVDYRTPSLSVPMEPIKLKLWARFIPATQDTLAITYEPTVVSVGDTVSQTVTVDSGSLPKVTVKGLPKGLKFDAKTLTITGNPTTPGIYTVSFSATNSTIKKPAVTKAVQFRVNNIRSAALPDLNYDGVYSLCVPGSTSYALDIPTGWTVKGLPAGMKWNAKTQSLSGAPTKPGFYTVTLTKKEGKETDTATITVEVLPFPTLTLTAIGEGEGTVKGAGDYAANKKVTLKATPAKGSVFAGWFTDPEGTTPVVSTVDYRTSSLPYVMTEVDTTLYACFVPATEDTSISITADLPVEDAGVTLSIPLDVTSYSLPKLTCKNLPKGLKYNAKTLTLTGAVTTPGTYTFTVAGTNATIKKATDATTATFTLQVLNRNDLIPDSSYDKDGTWTNVAAGELLDGVIFHEALVGTTVKGLPKGLKWDAATGTLSGTTWVYGTVTLTFTNKQKETTDITLEIAPPPEPTFSELGIWDDEMADYILVDRDDEATVSAGVPVEMLFSVKAGIGPTPPTVKVAGLPSGIRASQKKQDDTVYVTLKGTSKTIGNAEILVTATDLAKRTFTQLYHLLLTPTE